MDLRLILAALRRYWFVVVICGVLGALPAVLLARKAVPEYKSTAVLMVRSSDSGTQGWAGDPDRYVIGQIGVLKSDSLAAAVADQVGNGLSGEDIARKVEIAQQPATDLVRISATDTDAEKAQGIAAAYVDLYFAAVRTSVDDTLKPDLDQIQLEIDDLKAQLADVDQQIAARVAPYLPKEGQTTAQQYQTPGVDQIAPDLLTNKQVLLDQYNQLLDTKTELQLSARLRVTKEIVQRATLPTEPVAESTNLLAAAGGVGGVFVGVLVALVLARLSRRVINEQEAETILDHPFVGEMPFSRALSSRATLALGRLPGDVARFVDQLCVRAEATIESGDPVVIVVTSTQRRAGCTTLAAAMANRFAVSGQSVVLIDADQRNRLLSRESGRPTLELAALLAGSPATGGNGPTASRPPQISPVDGQPIPMIVSTNQPESITAMRRTSATSIMDVATLEGTVIIFDGGPLLDSAQTVQLALRADAVVLAVPVARQQRVTLEAVVRQLGARHGELLPIETSIPRWRRRSASPSVTPPNRQDPGSDADTERIPAAIGSAV